MVTYTYNPEHKQATGAVLGMRCTYPLKTSCNKKSNGATETEGSGHVEG